MHLPQVWCLGINPEARLAVHSAPEHRQREDVHLHLVLVRHPGVHAVLPAGVPRHDPSGALDEAQPAGREAPWPHLEGRGAGGVAQDRHWRLVGAVHARQEH